MKRLLSAILVGFLSASLYGVECRKGTEPYVGRDERGEPFLLVNRHTSYVITFRYTNPTPTQAPEVLVGMPEPVNCTGFSRRDFVHFQVNGIDSRHLEPKKYAIFGDGKEAGIDIYYNFNGVMMVLRFSVSEESPLLKMELRREAGVPAEAIQSLMVDFNVLPCASSKERNSYSRQVVTPERTYQSKPGVPRQRHKLSPKDTLLILQDDKYQADTGADHAGPVVLVPAWGGLLSGTAIFGTHQNVNVLFQLDPKASAWTFGLLDSENKRSNKAFRDFLRTDLGLLK